MKIPIARQTFQTLDSTSLLPSDEAHDYQTSLPHRWIPRDLRWSQASRPARFADDECVYAVDRGIIRSFSSFALKDLGQWQPGTPGRSLPTLAS